MFPEQNLSINKKRKIELLTTYMKNLSNKKLALIITCIYVGLGAVYSCLYWTNIHIAFPNDSKVLFYFFAPVAFIPIMILFAERDPVLYILIFETIAFIVTWLIAYGLISLFRKTKKQI